jgi:hypothetical protein
MGADMVGACAYMGGEYMNFHMFQSNPVSIDMDQISANATSV